MARRISAFRLACGKHCFGRRESISFWTLSDTYLRPRSKPLRRVGQAGGVCAPSVWLQVPAVAVHKRHSFRCRPTNRRNPKALAYQSRLNLGATARSLRGKAIGSTEADRCEHSHHLPSKSRSPPNDELPHSSSTAGELYRGRVPQRHYDGPRQLVISVAKREQPLLDAPATPGDAQLQLWKPLQSEWRRMP
jgi:hypothetical protein